MNRVSQSGLPPKVHPLVNAQGFLGTQGLQVPDGHSGVDVAELILERLGVAGLGQPGQGARVPQHVDGPHMFRFGNPVFSKARLTICQTRSLVKEKKRSLGPISCW